MPHAAHRAPQRSASPHQDDGLDLARRVVAGAPAWLAPGGALLFEVGTAQVSAATAIAAAAGLAVRVVTDEEAGATVVVGTAGPR